MEILQMLSQVSLVGLLSLAVTLLPLGAGLLYVTRPTERHLALMRPISLAALFAALGGTVLGFMNVLQGLWMSTTPVETRILAVGAAESLVPLFVGFGCLTVAWLCVAIGMRRLP